MNTTAIKFVKAEALGNTFEIYDVSKMDLTADPLPRIADAFSQRASGPGYDQVAFIDDRPARPTIRFFNADGTEAESCGNGSRAAGLLWLASHHVDTVTFHTKGGPVTVNKIDEIPYIEPGSDYTASVELVLPLPVVTSTPPALDPLLHHIALLHPPLHVSVGNPHLVLFPDIPSADLLKHALLHGPALNIASCFPAGINVGFAKCNPYCANIINIVVYERGAGFTKACGTGAIAAAAAAREHHLKEQDILIHQIGGAINVIFDTTSVRQIGKAHIMEAGILDITHLIQND